MSLLTGPLFVSWDTCDGRLRGCIGTFAPQPLETGLKKYACEAAFNDERFPPITAEELPGLECSVSLLEEFEDCGDYLDWDLGVHGVSVRLSTPDRTYSATFLPEIPMNLGWSKIYTIEHALRKSGWRFPISDEVLTKVRVRRYRSEKCSATWDEFLANYRDE